MQEIVQALINRSVDLLPRVIMGILIVLAGWLLATISKRLVIKFIHYLDRLINSRLQNRALRVDLKSTAGFIAKTIFWIIILFTIVIITQLLGLAILTTWFNALLGYLPNILAAVLIVFAGVLIGRLVGDLMSSSIVKAGIPKGDHIRKLVQFIILFVASVIAINQVGIDIQFFTNLITIIVAALLFGAALAFGLGASTSVSNILGSFYVQKSYREGNRVKIGDIEGVIVKITPTVIHIKTKTGKVTVPAKNFNEEKSELLKDHMSDAK